MLSTFLIALREGLEGSLIISILLSYLARTEKAHLKRFIWLGVCLAAGLSLGFGALLSFTSRHLSTQAEELFAGTTSLLSVAFVTTMVFWMRRTARNMGRQLQSRVDGALKVGQVSLVGQASQMGQLALVSAAFFSVAREGLETSLFLYANIKTVHAGSSPVVGLITGLIAAFTLGALLYRKSIHINLGKFFSFTGYGLIVVAAGVLSHGLFEFQSRGNLPGARAYAWNLRSQGNLFWSLLDGSFGIGSTLTWLQLVIWAIYLSVTLTLYSSQKSY